MVDVTRRKRKTRRHILEDPESDFRWITERGSPEQSKSPRVYQHDSGVSQSVTPSSNDFEHGMDTRIVKGTKFIFNSYIRKLPKTKKWRVYSESGRNLGTYESLEEAERRLDQIHYFKYLRKNRKRKNRKAGFLKEETPMLRISGEICPVCGGTEDTCTKDAVEYLYRKNRKAGFLKEETPMLRISGEICPVCGGTEYTCTKDAIEYLYSPDPGDVREIPSRDPVPPDYEVVSRERGMKIIVRVDKPDWSIPLLTSETAVRSIRAHRGPDPEYVGKGRYLFYCDIDGVPKKLLKKLLEKVPLIDLLYRP